MANLFRCQHGMSYHCNLTNRINPSGNLEDPSTSEFAENDARDVSPHDLSTLQWKLYKENVGGRGMWIQTDLYHLPLSDETTKVGVESCLESRSTVVDVVLVGERDENMSGQCS